MKLRLLSLITLLCLLLSMTACLGRADDKDTTTTTDTPTDGTTTGSPSDDGPSDTLTLTNALDLTAEWNKVAAQGSLVQGCVVVRKAFLQENPDTVEHFLAEYETSINYLSTNLEEAAQMIVDNGIFTSAPVAKKAIPKCNVCFLDGAEMKTAMHTYLEILQGINANAMGGTLPTDDFYYTRKAATSDASCGKAINVYTLNGTTGFGMAKLMNDAKNGDTLESYTFSVQSDATIVTAALINGSADIAALPTNAASTVYNKTGGEVCVIAVNTLGCLYLLTNQNETVSSFADLKGKTVYVPAQNPTFIFTYLCKMNGLEIGKDIIIDSSTYAKPADLRTAVAAGLVDIAVLPEPMVTIAINAVNAANAQK
ncbi:MAG: ABC transporter substrate-binding protein [Clostridia bacterium]|nr:ABC transporter substrate-binding protein [Clostridia bacterium]